MCKHITGDACRRCEGCFKKKSRPKRSPKKKAVAAKEEEPKEEDLLGCNPSEHGVRHEQPKEEDLLGCNPSEHGVRHEQPKEDEEPKKNVKIVELKECEKCGKKLTSRTLKYSHAAVCPANENTPPAKRRKKEAITPDPLGSSPSAHGVHHEEPKQPQVGRLRKRQETFNILFANAI